MPPRKRKELDENEDENPKKSKAECTDSAQDFVGKVNLEENESFEKTLPPERGVHEATEGVQHKVVSGFHRKFIRSVSLFCLR